MDWLGRYVLAWQLSNTLDGLLCRVAVRQALEQGAPTIFNSDQGAQSTANAFLLMDYAYVPGLEAALHGYFQFYNHERPHQSLSYRTPAEVHYA